MHAGHAAAEAALKSAGPAWADQASALFAVFVRGATGSFLTEDARLFAEANGLPPPPDKRAWGAIAMQAKRSGLTVPCGFAMTRSPEYNSAPKTLWRSAI